MNARATSLAAGQEGLLTHDQLDSCGYSQTEICHLVQCGYLERLERALYAVAGAPKTEKQAILAAVLAAGPRAAVSHECCANRWGVPGFSAYAVVSTPHECDHEFQLGKLHQSRFLPEEHVVVLNGVRVTCPERMLFDLAATLRFRRLERAANTLLAKKLTTVVALRSMLGELGKRGRAGTRNFRLLVEKLERARGHPESNLEHDFLSLVVNHGLPEPRLQVEIYDDDGFIARVDALWGPQLVIAEVDSDWFHTAPLDEEADALRDKRLRTLGYDIVRFSEHQIHHRPEHVLKSLRERLHLRSGGGNTSHGRLSTARTEEEGAD